MKRKEFIEKQVEYTRRRELEHIANNLKSDAAYKKELIKMYNQAQDRIVKEMESAYLRYSLESGLTMDEAMKKVSLFDVQAFAEKAKEYVQNKDFSDIANEQLRIYNLKMRMSRLELMKREILLESVKLADKEIEALERKLSDAALEEIERQAGILKMPRAARNSLIKTADKVVRGDFHSATFSHRVWMNNAELVRRLESGLEKSIMRGFNPKQWSRALRDLVKKEMGDTGKENALYAANRIAITETARVQTEVAKESFIKAGYEKYIWIAEPTACPMCVPFDGEIFDVHGSQIGGDLPPLHPHCRCSVAAYMERDW